MIAILILLVVFYVVVLYRKQIRRFLHKHLQSIETYKYTEYSAERPRFHELGLTDTEQSRLYELVNKIHTLFQQNDITHFAICGTLIGTMRHGGIIPWDDDADIGVLEAEDYKIRQVMPLARELGVEILDDDGLGFRGVDASRYIPESGEIPMPYVDIFTFRQVPDVAGQTLESLVESAPPVPMRFEYAKEYARKQWPREYFTDQELFPLREAKYGYIQIPVPNKAEEALERMYPKWKTKGVIDGGHRDDFSDVVHIDFDADPYTYVEQGYPV
jgi:hypothetical protein